MYRSLNPEKTITTIEILNRRIGERFPESSISRVCAELLSVANECKARAEKITRPNILLRLTIVSIVLFSVVALIYSLSLMKISIGTIDAGELVQLTEAGLNNVVLVGAAVFFLVTFENRIKRKRALTALHELRSLAHVIDMKQLTKDPARLVQQVIVTPSSPKSTMTAYELTRYLDYCSEMLSLTGKVAALYAQEFRDDVVLTSVNDLENLTTGLSRKIWQKIMILHKLDNNLSLK